MVQANPTYTSPYAQQWQFLPSHLQLTPSSEDGTMTFGEELEIRRRGVELIARICERLPQLDPSQQPEVKQMTMLNETDMRHWTLTHKEYQAMPHATYVYYAASCFLHRFYMRFALQDFPVQDIAATSLYLALKTEEVMKVKLRSLAQATKIELGWESRETKAFVASIVGNEDHLLEALCYDLAVEQPQSILIAAHSVLQSNRRRKGARLIIDNQTQTHTPNSLDGIKTPASYLGNKTPGSVLGNKTPGSTLGSVVDMEIDSPFPEKASLALNGNGKEEGELDADMDDLTEDKAEDYLLDLATEILIATTPTPLTLLAKPYIIASAVYLLAISMIREQSVSDSLATLNSNWEDAFLPQEGVKPLYKKGEFGRDVTDCCALIIDYHRRGLMNKDVLDEDMDVNPQYDQTTYEAEQNVVPVQEEVKPEEASPAAIPKEEPAVPAIAQQPELLPTENSNGDLLQPSDTKPLIPITTSDLKQEDA